MKKLEKIIQIIVNVFLVFSLVIIVFCVAGFIQLKVLKKPYVDIFGYTFFSVATGSMQPTLDINDIIIVKITEDVKVGDIITYREENDFITHRVISNNKDTFVTKGDYNNTEDNPIDTSKIVGKLVCKVPSLGLVGDILLTPKVFISVIITLFLFSLCFSYVPKEKKSKNKLTKIRKEKVEDGIDVKIIQGGKTNKEIYKIMDIQEEQMKKVVRYITDRLKKGLNDHRKTMRDYTLESSRVRDKYISEIGGSTN